MSLQDDINLLATLDEKSAGHLIRHNDWNGLVGVVSHLATAVKTIVDADLINKVAALDTTVNTLANTTVPSILERLEEVETSIAPLLQNYVMTLRSGRQHYALGEVCEITVQVTNLKSQFISPRPWVDFVCSWGRLRAATGFASSQLGEGGNSLSVQVNAEGIARVLLSSGTGNASAQQEMQMMAIMYNMVEGESYTVADAVMQAPTPGDSRAKKAYKQMHREYERADSNVWSNYADSYTVGNYGRWGGNAVVSGEWDYQYATVMAFARPDGNPTTPDGARAAASIQISFRDWVSSWGIDYVDDRDDLEVELAQDWGSIVVIEEENPLDKIWYRVEEQIRDRGIWGRQKYFEAGQDAINHAIGTGDPLRYVKNQASKALAAQAAADLSQMQAGGGRQRGAPVMGAYMAQGSRTESVGKQAAQAAADASQAKGLSESVAVLEGRMQSTEQLGSKIQGSLQLINENVRGINALDETSLKGGVQKISAEIAAIRAQLG